MGVIMHNNILYGGGSTIEPNPQESATEQLETLGIDGDVYEVNDADAIHTSDVGVANGVAELDSNGKVPSSQLPSFVDDVVEGYYDSNTDRFYEESTFTTVIPPTEGKSWVDVLTNKSYRWTGSVYVRVDEGVQLGETSDTAYRGDRGKIAYDHSQSDHSGIKPAFTEASTRANIASGETIATIFGKIKKFFSDLKAVAFSGSYNDLSDKPAIPTKTSDLTNDSDFVESSDLATVATSGSYNDLTNKPTIPAAQIQSNWTQTTTTALDYIKNKPTLATVATSGSYNDLSNKPTIPTVNNGTLTIQKNGTQVQTFTANQSGNATANITVPTKVSELTNDSGYTTNTGTVTQVKVGTTAYNPSSGVISLPAYPSDTNTHRPIQMNGTEILGNNTTALNLKAGTNVSLSNSSGTVTITATDTTYSSKSAASGGTDVSLCTTGEKYTWNNKSNLTLGTTATTAAKGNHTHTTSIATSTGTNQISLAASTKYAITAGDTSYVFTTPADTNTWRPIGTGASDAAAGNHTHTCSIATSSGTNQLTLAFGTKYALTAGGNSYVFTMPSNPNTDTKNTAGTTNTTSKIYLAGATSQAANPQTYSNQYCYANGNYLYSGGNRVATLNGTEDLTNKTYNGYTLADACAKAVQNSGSATALTASSLPTGQTITAYIKNNFMKVLWEGTVNSAKTQNYTTSAGDSTRFVLVKYDVTNAGVLYQLMVVGEATCLNLFAKGSANYPITVYQRDISVSKTSFTTGAGHYCRYNTYGSGEYLRILGIYALFYGA